MPTFESIIIGAPAGFSQSCCDLNSLVATDSDLLSAITIKSFSSANFVPSEASEVKYYNEIKAINFIVRSYKAASPVPTFPQMASNLGLNSLLSRDCVEKIIVAIQKASSDLEVQVIPILSQVRSRRLFFYVMRTNFNSTLYHYSTSCMQLSGKLRNLKWRVGVAMSSSKCKNLSAPYVLLSFDVMEVDGTVSHHSTELNYQQFQVSNWKFSQFVSIFTIKLARLISLF